MKQIVFLTCGVVAALSLIIGAFTFIQAEQERATLSADLQYRTRVLSDALNESIKQPVASHATSSIQNVVTRLANKERLPGIMIVDSTGMAIATSGSATDTSLDVSVARRAMDSVNPVGVFSGENKRTYIFAEPIVSDDAVIGALVVDQDASYIDDAIWNIWRDNLLRLLLQSIVIVFAIVILVRWVFFAQIQQLAESIRQERRGLISVPNGSNRFLQPIVKEIAKMSRSLKSARNAASEEARLRLEKIDTPWTQERLKEFSKELLQDRTIVVVSNLEPYIHRKSGNDITYFVPASGLITAIEPLMQACGGMWIARGSGDADKLVVDENDSIQVPPDDPKYTLKRIWLTEDEEKKYSFGFSDQALYPLFHMSHTRPVFREDEWESYKKVNAKYVQAVLKEIKDIKRPLILIQDFQLTLISRAIKEARPDAAIGIFWHIPWVSPEAFSICPWKKEIVDGILGADLIGFHTQQHCNNFIETVSRELEALIDYEQFSVTRHSHTSYVKPFPISIAYSNSEEAQPLPARETHEARELLQSIGADVPFIGVGADRLDYIKGIHERLAGIELFLEKYPEYIEQFSFIQISSPSDSQIKLYRDFVASVESEVERINARFATRNWKPIAFLPYHHTHAQLKQYYSLANFCLVSSLHDGMNLVAKEFVASRTDNRGALILSQFAGAAKELKEALIINPYNGRETAEAIHAALTMPLSEQEDRMKKMRSVVKNYNIFRWCAEFIKALAQLE